MQKFKIKKEKGKLIIGNKTIVPLEEINEEKIIFNNFKTILKIKKNNNKIICKIFDKEKQKWIGGIGKEIIILNKLIP